MYNVGDYVICKDIIGVVTATPSDKQVKLLCSDGVERAIVIDSPSSIGLITSSWALARLTYDKLIKQVK